MRIAICDSSYKFLNAVRAEILKINEKNFVYLYSSYDELMNNLCALFDAVIMNTEIGAENGIEKALKIKQQYPDTEIIFVTQFGEKYAQMIFYHTDILRPYAYFVKPVNRSYLRRVIVFLERELFKKNTGNMIITCTNGDIAVVPVTEISYIDHNNRLSIVHEKGGASYECRKKLSQLQRLLPDNIFSFCSKSCLINLSEVSLMSGQEIVMKNQERLFASRNYKAEFKTALDNYNGSVRKVSEIEEILV